MSGCSKIWDDFIARQVLAELKGEKVRIYTYRTPLYWESWEIRDATHCYVFGRLGAAGSEYWHVNPAEKRVCRYVRLL